MKAAWDWHFPRKTNEDEDALVAFVAELGFDTMVLNNPSTYIIKKAHDTGLRVVAVISPHADAQFADDHPECLQKMRPYEDGMYSALDSSVGETASRIAHRWFPYFQHGNLFCYSHEASILALKKRSSELLESADGIALDGFGFKNHYACFCGRCIERHGGQEPAYIAEMSEFDLIEISRQLRDHAKNQKKDAVVTNHVWPPYDPNPYYGAKLYLDYCTQTISWFYQPVWSLERVRFEAAEHKRLEIPGRNKFVPFIGLHDEPSNKRDAQRVAQEVDIALEYGDGSLVVCTLQTPKNDDEIRRAITEALHR